MVQHEYVYVPAGNTQYILHNYNTARGELLPTNHRQHTHYSSHFTEDFLLLQTRNMSLLNRRPRPGAWYLCVYVTRSH